MKRKYLRRMFIGNLISVPFLFLLPRCTKVQSKAADGGKESGNKEVRKNENDTNKKVSDEGNNLVDPSQNATARALSYVHDAKEAKNRKKDSAFCHNCQYYTSTGEVEGKAAGKCQLITGGLVTKDGWCQSWVEKQS